MRMIDLKNELSAMEVIAPGAIAASANGSAVDLQGYVGEIDVILDSSAATAGTNPTLDCKIQDSADGSTGWADCINPLTGSVYAFSQVTNAASLQSLGVDTRVARQYIRAVVTIGGTSSPSFNAAVLGVGQKKAA